jgi:hypothetical protein
MNSSVHRWVVGIILTDLLFIKRLKFRLSINGRCGLLRLMINARGRPMKKNKDCPSCSASLTRGVVIAF